MRRYLKSITLLALIAALFVGCETATDTPDVPNVEDTTPPETTPSDRIGKYAFYEPSVIPYVTDLSELKELNYNLYKFTDQSPSSDYGIFCLGDRVPFNERFYPLDNGCWAYVTQRYWVHTVDSRKNNNRDKKTTIPHVVHIVYPDGSLPHVDKTTSTGERNPLYKEFTVAMAYDTGDLLTARLYGKFKNQTNISKTLDYEIGWSTGELIKDNRFSRIVEYYGEMEWLYQIGPFLPYNITPRYALFDRFTRLTDYKYCELYASGDVFLGLYFDEDNILYSEVISETGEIVHSEAADLREEYPEEKNDYGYDGLTVERDSKTGLYYYVNAKGEAVCEPTFTECTNIKNGTAVVQIGSVLYMLVVTSAE
ncbi:MAG: hypothetical protein IJ281_05075 [Clostridia bacterium]|nr:hypothetical protein [Clostridia bacterium]